MKIVSNSLHHNCMSSIVSSCTPCTHICLAAEDINKFSFPLITELAAQNYGSHGLGRLCIFLSYGRLAGSSGKKQSTSEDGTVK